MKQLLLILSFTLGLNTTAKAEEKLLWAFTITSLQLPVQSGSFILTTPKSEKFHLAHSDIEKCRDLLISFVLIEEYGDSNVEFVEDNVQDHTNPNATLHYIKESTLKFIECSPKILKD